MSFSHSSCLTYHLKFRIQCSKERPKCRLCVHRNISCECPGQFFQASTNSPSASKTHLADSPGLSR
ncbi:hypothetical protein FOC4_g10004075 [Fusarium odoratissimum]|uniref:Zn(2)-C6 fungal-type domain-containing protein n=2 Tax=Fusarium oxysporum species complex TaxID=171631 RepID=N1S2D2_FUSC4|nr:hypothetical protein FOC4_g10004075 [Fusarium odoratissimum]TXB96040.1 hypothetical protein FocTR4_00016778 [Fusarium oxysporum f. sp. cubense]